MADHRSILTIICLLFASFALNRCEAEYRNVTTEYLTSATEAFTNDSCNNLVHTTARGKWDALHYVYSTTGRPSVLIARTGKDAKLTVDWDRFVSSNESVQDGSISFDGPVASSALLSFDTIYIFNDTNDKAQMSEGSNFTVVYTRDLLWQLSKPNPQDQNRVSFVATFRGGNATQTVNIEFLASSGTKESTSELPHLLLNGNLTEINVNLLDLSEGLVQPRVGLGLTLIAGKEKFQPAEVVEEKSLNDELSPGAFRTLNWLDNEVENTKRGAFVQWKPICYVNKSERGIQTLTRVTAYALLRLNGSTDPFTSLATGFYGRQQLETEMWTSSVNVSFGITGDRFYSKTNFVTWQLTFGLGSHPHGSVSILIVLLIAIGLGVPLLVMVAGAIYLPIRSRMLRRRGYEELSSSYPRIG